MGKDRKNKRRFQSEALQKRIIKSTERSQGSGKNIIKIDNPPMWRPKDGEHIIDILPYFAGKYDSIEKKGNATYTYEYWVHNKMGVNEIPVVCLAGTYNKPCPICEERQRLINNKVDEQIHGLLRPKRRNIYNIISYDEGEEAKGVQIWEVSYHYFEKLVLAISKKVKRSGKNQSKNQNKQDSVDFISPEEGKSISFKIEPAKGENDYPKFVGHSFEDRDYEISDKLLDKTYVLDNIVQIYTYEEAKEIYFGPEKSKRKKKDDDDDEDDDNTSDDDEDDDDSTSDDDEDDEDDNEDEDDDDSTSDDDDDEDEEDDEKDDDDEEDLPTKKEIRKMKKKELKKLIKDRNLDVDPEDADDTEDLQDMIMDELDID